MRTRFFCFLSVVCGRRTVSEYAVLESKYMIFVLCIYCIIADQPPFSHKRLPIPVLQAKRRERPDATLLLYRTAI